jgi:hypothetical protein
MTETPVNTGPQPFRQDSGTARNGVAVPVPAVPPPYRAERHGTPERNRPAWLTDKINVGRRAARPNTCPRCSARTLVGDDHHRVAAVARVDAEPVGRLGEVVGVLSGRPSYDMVGAELHYRNPPQQQAATACWPIHLEHRCPALEESP